MSDNTSWEWETVLWTIPLTATTGDQLKRRWCLDLILFELIKLVLFLKGTLVFDGFRWLFVPHTVRAGAGFVYFFLFPAFVGLKLQEFQKLLGPANSLMLTQPLWLLTASLWLLQTSHSLNRLRVRLSRSLHFSSLSLNNFSSYYRDTFGFARYFWSIYTDKQGINPTLTIDPNFLDFWKSRSWRELPDQQRRIETVTDKVSPLGNSRGFCLWSLYGGNSNTSPNWS